MIPIKAYELAEKGGYEIKEEPCSHVLMHDESGCPFGFHYPPWQVTALDPAFFQSLGKALGWGWECEECGAEALGADSFHCLGCQKIVRLKATWNVNAHRFYDLILTDHHIADGPTCLVGKCKHDKNTINKFWGGMEALHF